MDKHFTFILPAQLRLAEGGGGGGGGGGVLRLLNEKDE